MASRLGTPLLACLCTLPIIACTAYSLEQSKWPVVKAGVWETTSTRTSPDGETQTWTLKSRRCPDTTLLFRGYWGLGTLERAGCRFEPSRRSDSQFTIKSECNVRGVGLALTEATVTLKSDSEFYVEVLVHEGPKEYRARQTARLIGACEQ